MPEIERIPLRAEAEKLLEVADYLAYRMRQMGISVGQSVSFDLPGFGKATVHLWSGSGKIMLEFPEGA